MTHVTFADHVAILHGGQLVLTGGMEAVKAEWNQPLEEIFMAVAGGGSDRQTTEVHR